MKITRTIMIPKQIEVEAQYTVLVRRAAVEGQGCYCPPSKWGVYALCGDDKELAEQKKVEANSKYLWVDVKIALCSDEELATYQAWAG